MVSGNAGGRARAWDLPPPRSVTVFVGNYGSGKTEIALNYALWLASAGRPVSLADLDIVNPYFRSREARAFVEQRGVAVIAPEGEYAFADLPILLREVGGAIGRADSHLVLDVGGDDLGARVLGGFAAALAPRDPLVLQVLNERRPFTNTLAGGRRMYEELQAAARLQIGGLVANAHLIDETTPAVVQQGIAFARQVGAELGVPLVFAAIEERIAARLSPAAVGCPVLLIERLMTSPWEPSTRRGPIGRPPPATEMLGAK